MQPTHSPFLKNILAFGLLTIVAIATYSNAMRSGFFLDDTWMFDQDRIAYVQAKTDAIFFHKSIPETLNNSHFDFSYRPLSQWIPLANYLAFKNNILGYHIVSLILFIFCIFMIFLFLMTICKNFFVSLTASLLFLTHPINNLMVNYISAQTFSIQLLLMTASSLSFLRHHKNPKNYFSLIFSLLTFYLATLCHESALALPLVLTTLTLAILKIDFKNTLKKLWPFYTLGSILVALWFFKTSTLAQGTQPISWPIYSAGIAQLETWYISKLLFLHGVLMMYVIPLKNISLIYGWSILIGALSVLILTRHLWIQNRFVVWTISLLGIGILLTTTGAKFQSEYGLTIAPHWLYFCSIGFFLITAQGLHTLRKYHPNLPVISASVVILFCGLTTFRFNHLWTDQLRYAQYCVEQNPDFTKNHLILADMYFNKQLYTDAEEHYLSALNSGPLDDKSLSQLGRIAEINKRYSDAAKYYQKSLTLNPDNPKTLNNLAIIYIKTNQLDKAEHLLQQTLANHPEMLPLRINLAVVYEKQNRITDAINALQENLAISPNDPQTLSAFARFTLKQTANP